MMINEPTGHGAFPAVGADIVDGTAGPSSTSTFLTAVRQWRPAAVRRLDEMAVTGAVSAPLRDLLVWALGDPWAPVNTRYPIGRIPGLENGEIDECLAVLVWRSSVVDFLADVWDTIGPADFDVTECGTVIENVFTPDALRGVLVCPDCIQLLTNDPLGAGGQHSLHCPIRLRRLLGQ